jgi:hypothetical protein
MAIVPIGRRAEFLEPRGTLTILIHNQYSHPVEPRYLRYGEIAPVKLRPIAPHKAGQPGGVRRLRNLKPNSRPSRIENVNP